VRVKVKLNLPESRDKTEEGTKNRKNLERKKEEDKQRKGGVGKREFRGR